MTFLEALEKGKQFKTKSGFKAKFVAMLSNKAPAPVVMEVFYRKAGNLTGWLENYYWNGKYLGVIDNHMDLVIDDL